MPNSKRPDNSFTKDEIEAARRIGFLAIQAAKDQNPAGTAWYGAFLIDHVGEIRARKMLGIYADAVLKSRS